MFSSGAIVVEDPLGNARAIDLFILIDSFADELRSSVAPAECGARIPPAIPVFGTFAGDRAALYAAAPPAIKETIMGELSRDRLDRLPTIKDDVGSARRVRALEILHEHTRAARGSNPSVDRAKAPKPPHELVLTARTAGGRLILARRQV